MGITDRNDLKTCVTCGRRIEWRRKWANTWESVRFCSTRCRRHRPSALDRALEATILELLEARAATSTICPSEAARAVRPDAWPPLMERARQAARRLVASGRIVITQRGQVVDPSTARGPIRLRFR